VRDVRRLARETSIIPKEITMETPLETTSNATREPVRLALLSIETGRSIEDVEREIGPDAFRAGGFRCCTAFRASEFLAEHERRQEAAKAAQRRQAADLRARHAEIRRKRPVARGVPHEPLEGLTLAEVMTSADGPPRYDDGIYVPAPSAVDYAFGVGVDEGGTFGPTPMQLLEQAERRERNRARRKGVRS
jgi:hypothetical protein